MYLRLSRKKLLAVGVILILHLVFSVFVLKQIKSVYNQNTSPANIVADLEKRLIDLQTKKITLGDFLKYTNTFIHPQYIEIYSEKMINIFDRGIVALNTTATKDIEISKSYSNAEGDRKIVFVKIPIEGTTNKFCKTYILSRDEDAWKIMHVSEDLLIMDRETHYKIRERYSNYKGKPIEYFKLEM